jgi:hypothetical protein
MLSTMSWGNHERLKTTQKNLLCVDPLKLYKILRLVRKSMEIYQHLPAKIMRCGVRKQVKSFGYDLNSVERMDIHWSMRKTIGSVGDPEIRGNPMLRPCPLDSLGPWAFLGATTRHDTTATFGRTGTTSMTFTSTRLPPACGVLWIS